MKSFLLVLSMLISQLCYSQFDFVKEAYPTDVLQIHSGHSLTDPLFNNWPGQYVNLVGHVNGIGGWELFNAMVGKSTGPGSSINYRWENSTGFPDARLDIVDWELLSITERIPLLYEGGNTQQWYIDALDEQREDLSIFVNHAWNNGNGGNGTPTLLWTTWVRIDGTDGDFRSMLDIQGTEWENMQAYANDNRPTGADPVFIIPGHKMMARIYDDIQAGLVPGITDISQLFDDNVHVNELGAYAVSMMHYACIFNKSPVGLPNDLQFGTVATFPSVELAAYFQNIVVDIVTSYPETGITSLEGIMPIDLLHFNAKAINNNSMVQIDWVTRSEKDNDFFTIERSQDGKEWRVLVMVQGGGNSSIAKEYDYLDRYPLNGVSYYRLKQTDFDGDFEYFDVKQVSLNNPSYSNLKLSPNPAHQFLDLVGSGIDPSEIRVYNRLGVDFTSLTIVSDKGGDRVTIDVSSLNSGTYFIQAGDKITDFVKL